MAASLYPSCVRINYHSAYAPHSQLIPTRQWNDVVSSGGQGTFDTHNSGSVDADTMINDLATALAGILPDTASFDSYIIYNVDPDTEQLLPQTSKPMVIAGLDTTPGWSKATQVTMNWRTNEVGIFKVVLLDNATNNVFDKTLALPGSGVLFDVDALVTDADLGWSGRDNARPVSFISQTVTLNEALRKRYRMA